MKNMSLEINIETYAGGTGLQVYEYLASGRQRTPLGRFIKSFYICFTLDASSWAVARRTQNIF